MERADAEPGQVVAGYATGTVPVAELNRELAAAWNSLLSDPLAVADAARAIGVSTDDFRKLDRPLFELGVRQQGLGVVETAIVVFVGQIALDVGKDLAKDALEAGLKKLWSFVKARMELSLPLHAFGREAKLDEDGDGSTSAS